MGEGLVRVPLRDAETERGVRPAVNQLTTALLVGATLVIQRSMFPADICRMLEREQVTGLAGVPMLWTQLAQQYSPFLKTEFKSLRFRRAYG